MRRLTSSPNPSLHRRLEAVSEKKLGDRRIGTTCRGIGPAYEDKVARRGIRVGELRHPDALQEKLSYLVAEKNAWIAAQGEQGDLDTQQILSMQLDFWINRPESELGIRTIKKIDFFETVVGY